METHALTTCPACGGDEAADFEFSPEHRLRRCRKCSLVYAPAFADPTEVYVEGYLSGRTDFGIDVFHPLFQEFLAFCAEVRLDVVETRQAPPASWLDVGCGTGEVLAVARERGWDVAGAEPVDESARYARDHRGLDVRTAMLDDAGFPERHYDVVSAFHVLEHMTEGVEFLEHISRWCKPGGHVVVEVPNWRSMHRWAHGPSWPSLRPLEHLAHYTPATLRSTLRRTGLQPVLVETPGFIWRKQTLPQMLNDLAGSRWRRGRRVTDRLGRAGVQDGQPTTMATPFGFALLRAVQAAYGATNRGMVVLAIAKVP